MIVERMQTIEKRIFFDLAVSSVSSGLMRASKSEMAAHSIADPLAIE
jgi:hypothetical protein